jgi:gluconolactonase
MDTLPDAAGGHGDRARAAASAADEAPVIRALDPGFSRLVPEGAKVEKIVEGHDWVEGPVWVRDGGYLLFSDVVRNAIYHWKDGEAEEVLLERSGYSGTAPFAGAEPGSNGLAIDAGGRLVFARHGAGRSPVSSRTAVPRCWPIAMRASG